jgi:hypothetical protein
VVLNINADKHIPDLVKDLMHVRLKLKRPHVEQPDGATGPAHADGIQLLPGS